mmetsp:Transcript_71841/g.166213  ORF Transcript_71841/g.166213 Transcript_71841/m.166213 type:complete len:208 (+) Transcript_71841:637-1260(+)
MAAISQSSPARLTALQRSLRPWTRCKRPWTSPLKPCWKGGSTKHGRDCARCTRHAVSTAARTPWGFWRSSMRMKPCTGSAWRASLWTLPPQLRGTSSPHSWLHNSTSTSRGSRRSTPSQVPTPSVTFSRSFLQAPAWPPQSSTSSGSAAYSWRRAARSCASSRMERNSSPQVPGNASAIELWSRCVRALATATRRARGRARSPRCTC